ncbi:hypothetical protein I3842_09G183800 [Carya illinoinensis]|uniref:Uncharacterized protein n=1 Tax=Carya illinoinensis TaxID=32201 RepID=A0A922E5G4_CARIL|nr:hypothetical protein I3842_09G183800 [Carya illinoinensis]
MISINFFSASTAASFLRRADIFKFGRNFHNKGTISCFFILYFVSLIQSKSLIITLCRCLHTAFTMPSPDFNNEVLQTGLDIRSCFMKFFSILHVQGRVWHLIHFKNDWIYLGIQQT